MQLADASLARPITHYARFSFCSPNTSLSWTIDGYIGQFGHYQAVLGLPWIRFNSHHINLSASPEQLLTLSTLPAISSTVTTVVDDLLPCRLLPRCHRPSRLPCLSVPNYPANIP